MSETKLTAQQKAQLFALSTRQNHQMLPRQTASVCPATLQFSMPKTRFLAGLKIHVSAVIHSSEELTMDVLDYWKSIRRISLDLNNGFAPFVLSGVQSLMYNLLDNRTDYLLYNKNEHQNLPKKINANEDTTFEFTIDVPITINPRDPVGLILLQNEQTNVTLTIDMANGSEMSTSASASIDLKNVQIDVLAETFSIPSNENAYPDISVLKLCTGRADSLPTAGQQIVKLQTGLIYRKLMFRLTDEYGNPMGIDDITSNIELVFNQADINYSLNAKMIRILNEKLLGHEIADGIYIFDFSNAGGFTNLGGTRDYIDTANLTEFWIRFTTSKRGKIEIVSETLSRLI